ncbi:uncharacterized protein LOC121052850 [Rosa chinensis]|uniref:uncharacterized protein LOC121052850 n=1 Tax=Rosa chinensis TaxID=74649 RepID=UPI001AD8B3C2|nr:uncharacterized protein LOC121052850 [Rosa chinensis]
MNWIYHGESPIATNHANSEIETEVDLNVQDDMFEMLHEAMGIPNMGETDDPPSDAPQVGPNQTTSHFLKLLEGAQLPLYPGCKRFTALSFIVRMMHNKVLHGWSDKSFTGLLKNLASAFPEGVLLPKSYYEARKITKDLGFTYQTWDACRNNCMLFRNDDINLDECKVCKKSRWEDKKDSTADVGTSKSKKKAVKQVRYFPLKPRLKRLFMSSKTAKLMRWHAEERENDGVFRHPADSMAWKDFDTKNSDFSNEIRNVRLGLASDGFNPFRTMNIVHSTWPVIVFPYNLPPSLCMKQPFLFLSLLIDGPKGPGDKIDVYLQPLIEELLELWERGVETWDASSNEMFTLHASLLWTINDFPAYANLSGWSTKGQYACPCCNSEIDSCWLSNGKKHSYGGHRRWLPNGHRFRKDGKNFNAKLEFRAKPNPLSGVDLLRQIESEGIVTEYKREDLLTRKRKLAAVEVDAHGKKKRKPHNWKKKSIFFELPYWKHNLIRHNLDVMHIEKNVCDNVLWTILGDAKSKDNLNSRRDLQEMNIKNHLHLKIDESGKPKAPDAEFEMKNNGKDLFLNVIHEYRAPDGHASNISRRVRLQDRTMGGLKSHDCHILVQELIPLAIRKSLPKNVVEVLIDLGNFFKQLC